MTRVDPRRPAFVTLLVTVLLAPAAVHAQSAEAEVLFREGRRLIKAGRIEAGCDKLEASERLEPSVGTLLNLGDCREKLGRLASAWAAFTKAEAMAKVRRDDKRRNEATRRALRLEPRLSQLVIAVPAEVSGLEIERDGEVVDRALWNTPVPVDPDLYEIVAEAPGHKPWRTQLDVTGKLRRQTVTIPMLEQAPPPPRDELAPTVLPPVTRAPPPRRPAPSPAPAPQTFEPSPWTTPRKVAVGLGVAGLAAAGTGVYFGLRSWALQDDADALCPGRTCDVPEGLRLNDRAKRAARDANIAFAVGGGAAVISVIVWLVGGPDREAPVTPALGTDHAGVALAGRF